MYLVAIAWLYVAVMMSLAEAFSSNGSILGAVVTFVLYGALPIGLVIYILGTPARKRALRERESALAQPDAGSLPPTDPVPPVGKEP